LGTHGIKDNADKPDQSENSKPEIHIHPVIASNKVD